MDKSGAKFKFVGHSTKINRQSKNKGTLHSKMVRFVIFQLNYLYLGLKIGVDFFIK